MAVKLTRAEYNVACVINQGGFAGATWDDFGTTLGRAAVDRTPLSTMQNRGLVVERKPLPTSRRKAYFLTTAGIEAFAAAVQAASRGEI
jgi:hypothetical protein